MRHLLLVSMMIVAAARANAETCALRTPLKATRPTNLSRWESLPAGAELSVVLRKTDWTRVLRDNTMHIVATTQFDAACTAAPSPAAKAATTTKAEAPTTTAKVDAAKAETKAEAPTTTAKTETKAEAPTTPTTAKAEAPTTTAKVEAAKTEAPTTTEAKTEATTEAKAEAPATTAKLALSSSSSSTTPGQFVVVGALLLGAIGSAVFFRRRAVVEQQHLDVVATRVLGRGKQLVVVDAGESRLLLGVTEQGITLLSSSPGAARPQSGSFASPSLASMLTPEEQAATSTPATSLFKGLGQKVNGLWGRPPPGPPSDWDNFDRILASTLPSTDGGGGGGFTMPDAAPANSRRPAERSSSVTGSADLAELTRELQRHGVRRSA